MSLARARFRRVPAGEDRIPGAVERVIAAGVTWGPPRVAGMRRGPFAALRLRHVGPYPLVEDGSVRGGGSTLVGAEVGMALAGGATVRVSALNLLDARADDVQYLYSSRLPGEAAAGVVDVHGHPAPPRQLRVAIEWGL